MIYLISDIDNGYCKIGYSIKPFKRLHELKVGNSSQIQIEAVILGDRQKEKQLHEMFSHIRVNREWFFFRDEIKEYFNCGTKSGFDNFEIFPMFLSAVCQFTSANYFKVLLHVIKNIENNSIKIQIRYKHLENLASTLSISLRMVQVSFNHLIDVGIILKPCRGQYLLNPQMLYNGNKNNRILDILSLYEKGIITDEAKEKKYLSHNPHRDKKI